ncbi:hypothetical protein Tco_0783146 [Tanacetum coccineum]
MIPQTTAISNIKLPNLKRRETYEKISMDHGLNAKRKLEALTKLVWWFQQLLSQLEAHGAEVSTEDANHKFLRSLPSAWSNLAMTMRTNHEIDNLSIDDLTCILLLLSTNVSENKVLAGCDDEILNEMDHTIGKYNDCLFEMKKFYKKQKDEFACGSNRVQDGKKKSDSPYQHQEAGKQEKNQMGLLIMDDGIVNWGEHTEAEETKSCSFGYQLKHVANEIHEKYEKLKRYRRIGMKAVKEKEQLQNTVDSWKDSSKNLWRLIIYGMSSNDKLGLGKPSYSRFTKTNEFKGVPPPLSGDYTPQPQEEIDDSLSVQLNAGRPKFNTVRPNINTGRTNINSGRPKVNAVSPKVNSEHPLKNMVDRGIFDSGCSGHMTGNKDQLEDFEEFNGGSVTFGGSKGYISGKGRIRVDKPNVKGVGYRWMFDIDYLTDSMNYIPVSLENQANPHAGNSEVTNSAGTPTSIASEEKDEEVELIVVPSAVRIPEEKDLEEIALKHLGTVPENNTTSTSSVNTGSHTVNTGRLEHDDSLMPELEIFHKPETGIFDEASYDEEGVITDFNSLPTEIESTETIKSSNNIVCFAAFYLRRNLGRLLMRYIDEQLGSSMQEELFSSRLQQEQKRGKEVMVSEELKKIGWKGFTQGRRFIGTDCGFCSLVARIEAIRMKEVTPKTSHLNAVKRIFKYLKGKPNLGLWYPRESPFDLEAFSDSDYGGSNLDRKSTTGGCQFLGQRLISWQCKKQTIVATSTAEAEYVAAAIACGQSNVGSKSLPSWDAREECQGFAEIVDFLRGSNLRYALTTNPTIYDSLIKQFWQTATANTNADGTLEIKATIDTIRYTISEASIRDSLQLDDATGITMLPNDELFEKLMLSEQVSTAEGVNTGSIKLSTGDEKLSTGDEQVSTAGAKKSTFDSIGYLAKSKEVAKQVHLDSLLAQRIAEEEELNEQQKKRKAQVQFEAQHYTNEDWDLIRAKLEANAELSKSMLGSELQGEDFAQKMVDLVNQRKKYFTEERARAKRNKPMTQSQLKTYMMNYLKNQGTWCYSHLKSLSLKKSRRNLISCEQVESFAP